MPARRTHEEYERQIEEKPVEVLGKYEGAHTEIEHRCTECNHTWDTTPNIIIQGSNCPKCAKESMKEKMSKSPEEYVKEIEDRDITVLEEYVNSYTKILHQCDICSYKWKTQPHTILNGKGCPKCVIEDQRITHQEYKEKIEDRAIKVLEAYDGYHTKIKHRCKECNFTWRVTPDSILSKGTGCPQCAGVKKRTTEEYKKEIEDKPIEVSEPYINHHTAIEHTCKKCHHTWSVSPQSILGHNSGCPKCDAKKRTRTHQDYIEELEDRPIKVLEKYQDSHTKILHKCQVCNYKWGAEPGYIVWGNGCPNCNNSKGEKEISNILDRMGIDYSREYRFDDCKAKRSLPFDFAVLDQNNNIKRLIEYHGIQHYEPIEYFGGEERFEERQEYDKIKKDYCQENNIPLTVIPYTEKDSIEKILKSELAPSNKVNFLL